MHLPCIAALASVCLLATHAAAQPDSICVDPGHGGTDPGALGCGLQEKNINLDTALRLRDLLQAAGLTVVMTRSTDVYSTPASRAELANSRGVDRFVSIHSNSADPPGTGIETFCAVGASSASFDLRDRIQAEMVATWPLRNRGGKTANYTVLTNTNMPATLSELAFINMCSPDAEYLASPAERQRAAEAHLRAILAHLGVQPAQKGALRGVVFEDQGVGTADMSVRLPLLVAGLLGIWTRTRRKKEEKASSRGRAEDRKKARAEESVRGKAEGRRTAQAGEARLPLLIAGLLLLASLPALGGEERPLEVSPMVVKLGAECWVAGGEYGRPVLSSDGQRVLFTRRTGLDGLWVKDLGLAGDGRGNAGVRQLSATRGAGLAPEWSADGASVGLRDPARPFAAEALTWLGLDGKPAEAPVKGGLGIEQRGEEIWLVSLDAETRLMGGPDGLRCFAPRLSPDGRYAVWNELTSGLHLQRLADGARTSLGAGNHAAFGPDGALLAFDRSQDDGHRLTAGEILLVDLRGPEPRLGALTRRPERLEIHPSLSRLEGGRAWLAFEAAGQILIVDLVLE